MAPNPTKGSKTLLVVIVLVLSALVAAGVYGGTRDRSRAGLVTAVRDCDSLNHFPDAGALDAFLRPPAAASTGGGFFGWGTTVASGPGGGPMGGTVTTYSTTNNQVAGVDEADIVKTDGRRIYTVSDGEVVVLDAYPPSDAAVLARIPTTGVIAGLFVNGDRLVVLESGTASGSDDYYRGGSAAYYLRPTRVLVYSVADPAAPALVRSVEVSGGYVGARMIGDYVYLVAQDYAYTSGSLPTITVDGGARTLTARGVGYFPDSQGGTIATVTAVRLAGAEGPAYEAFLTSGTSQIYVSAGSVYIAGSEYAAGDWWNPPAESSTIHRVSIDAGTVRYACSVRVPGTILNQFSMDEYDGYLRVATTVGHVARGGGDSRNNVYVADPALEPVGSLEGLAPGEQIHSARFMGDRAYLVTFKKIDPLFVIDLSDPRAPRVLGYLKVPGYSDYLHPYDATHVLGIGKDTHDMGDFAWYQGLKVSLFDVSDVEHPAELATYRIGDRGTNSEVLQDHKAFLFIPARSLVVLPVYLYEVDPDRYAGEAPPEAYGEFVWQGAYVLSVTLDGIALRARVSHGADPGTSPYDPTAIRRSLYIEDVLYTVSRAWVYGHDMDTFAEVASVVL